MMGWRCRRSLPARAVPITRVARPAIRRSISAARPRLPISATSVSGRTAIRRSRRRSRRCSGGMLTIVGRRCPPPLRCRRDRAGRGRILAVDRRSMSTWRLRILHVHDTARSAKSRLQCIKARHLVAKVDRLGAHRVRRHQGAERKRDSARDHNRRPASTLRTAVNARSAFRGPAEMDLTSRHMPEIFSCHETRYDLQPFGPVMLTRCQAAYRRHPGL